MHQVASLLGFHGSRDIRYLSPAPVPNGYLSPAPVPNGDALCRPAAILFS